MYGIYLFISYLINCTWSCGLTKEKNTVTPAPLYVKCKQELSKLYPSDKHSVSILSAYLYFRQIVSDKVDI